MSKAITRRHQDIRRMRECYTRERRLHEFVNHMGSLFADPSVSLTDFRVRPMFEALVDGGRELIDLYFNPNYQGGFRIQEAAADVVNTSLFANIQGQYLYNAILRAYQMPELIGDMLVTVVPSNEISEKIPGVTAIGDQIEVINEGQSYARAVTTERWVETPDTIKRGLIVEITKEAIYFDKTNRILGECSQVGKYIAINRERRILDVVCGISTVYKRNGAAATATYDATNTSTSNALTDWTSLDEADTKYSAITDPDSGEPIVSTPTHVVVPPALRNTVKRIRNATQVIDNSNASAGTRNQETRTNGNSLMHDWTPLSNQYVKERTSSDTTWFYGNMPEAFVYMQNWPITVDPMPAGNDAMWERDIVAGYKASERGAAGVMERLYAMKVTA